MTAKISRADFEHLAKVLEENRNAKISDSHWKVVHKMMCERGKQFEVEEKLLRVTWHDMQRPFDL